MLSRTLRILVSHPNRVVRSSTTSRHLGQTIEMETVDTTERLRQLRGLMKQQKVDIYSMLRSDIVNWRAD